MSHLFHHRQKIAFFLLYVFITSLASWQQPAYGRVRLADNNWTFRSGDLLFHSSGNQEKREIPVSLFMNAEDHGNKERHIVSDKKPAPGSGARKFIGGPNQPESQAFQSVNSNNMVDLFTGDFSYNIPLLDAGGYPIGLSYRSGISMDQEASWVGLGWNINPGSITRNVRGLPDDFNGTDSITKELNTKKKWTAGVNVGLSSEIFGKDLKFLKNSNPTIGIYYDNYTGPGFQASLTPGLNAGEFSKGSKTSGVGNFTLGVSFDSKSGFNLNPSYNVSLENTENGRIYGKSTIGLNYNSRAGLQDLQINGSTRATAITQKNNRIGVNTIDNLPVFGSSISFNAPAFTPTITMPSTYAGFTFTARAGTELFGWHPLGSITGTYNQNFIAPKDRIQKLPAYGYLNMSRSVRDNRALLDFNREKDIPYRKDVPTISIPYQTYDVFSISGEGTGGSFRAYRGDVGIIHDHEVKTKSSSSNIGVDFGGPPNVAEFGADVRFTYATTENKKWEENNIIKKNLSFRNSDTTFESVYFRNPGEQTSNSTNYYESIGDEDVVRINLTGNNYNPTASNILARFNKQRQVGTLTVNAPIVKSQRDKRSQVISYLSAYEASQIGFEKEIRSYNLNTIPLGNCDSSYERISRVDANRKSHHISEITVLNPDGRRYIYGIPAYNLVQKEATFAVDQSDAVTDKGLVAYDKNKDVSSDNDKGKDGYFNLQTTPANAHSFLLTELLSTDYADVTGNGISDDDIGDAVKFNYTRMKWSGETAFRWRAPINEDSASYDEGLRTDNSDDKGHFVYGEKEIWYLNSIESKTMIATFTLDTDSLRKDGFEVKGFHGGRSTSSTKKLMRLKEINLYSKADLKKSGNKARPIKTVHFVYSYRLCKGYPDLKDMNTGKLTLESVYFTYNGVKRGKENPYVFNYHSNNPDYKYKAYDRWGNYKQATNNPAGIPVDEYPYAVKDSATAAANAGAWNLTEINLPSGAKMKVEYESDDYGFVQNRRAQEMFQIAGFSKSLADSASLSANLYSNISNDNKYVYVDVPVSVADKQDIQYKYLQDAGKLYFKLYTQMPEDGYGSGSEYIPVYAGIKNYGRVNSNRIWIELEASPEGNNKSPLATAAIQFLKLNLPSKAYRGSDVGNDPAFKAAVMAVLSIVPEVSRLLTGGFNNNARLFNLAKTVTLSHSFVRLASPRIKKMGGGHRVKKITISDNWQKMADHKESVYGQEYAYTATRIINGKQQQVSSGVASYEPLIGNEENPFRQPVEYKEKATLAPSNFLFVEEPYAESLFPSAGVGYSKVRVSSINRKNIKSAPGFEETEFYTAYDFPTLTDMTSFDKNSYKKGIDVFKPFGVRSRKFITLSQGFKIELNDMHGKMKSSAVFAETDSLHPIFYSAQFYRSEKINGESFKLVNKAPTILYPSGFVNDEGQIGKDIELIADMREQYSSVQAGALEFNVNHFVLPVGVFPLFLTIASIIPDFHIENSRYRSAALLKVIQRYGILDSVVVIDKGSKVSTRNLLWDAETGEVLATQTQNEFNDPVYQFNYPAHWAYSGMGPAYKNIDAVLQNVNISGGKVASVNGGQIDIDVVNRLFESGDEVLVMNTPIWFFPSEGCYPPAVKNRPTRTSFEKRIWAVDRAKVTGGAKDIYFIDRNGNEYTGHGVNLRIVRSGRRNMASVPVGSVTSLKTPFKEHHSLPIDVVNIDSTINVLSASAMAMKDVWSVENRFDRITLCDSTNKAVDTSFTPYANGLAMQWRRGFVGSSLTTVFDGTELATPYFTASRQLQSQLFFTNDRQTRGIIQFDLNSIPAYAIVDSARLDLNGVIPHLLWEDIPYWVNVSKAHTINVNESELLRIVQPWNTSTKFQEYDNISTQTSKVTIPASTSTCQNYQVNIKNMVQDMVADPATNYGILLKETNLADMEHETGTPSDVSHMSFCGSFVLNRPASEEAVTPCSDCSSAMLNIKYHYRNDSCYTVCSSIFDGRINPYVQGIWGNWKSVRSYVYYDRRKESDPLVAADVRTAGVIKDFRPFWANLFIGEMFPSTNDTIWVWNNEITRYNRRGLETENHDPLNRFNSALYGYSNTLPIAVAQNSRYREMTYDGFEDYSFATDSCITSCITPRHFDFSAYKDSMVTTQHHTGKASLRLGTGSQAIANSLVKIASDSISPALSFTTGTSGTCNYFDKIQADSNATYPVFTPQPGQTMVLSAWVKEDKDCQCTSYTGNSIDVLFYHSGSLVRTVTRNPSGWIIEGWQRYDDSVSVPANADSMVVKLKNSTDVPVYFDDLRLHPFNSNMKSFVYHPVNLRLLAELDENNYASFYEYDDEGTLIRVKKETERGIKTIRETRSAMQKAGN